MNDMLCRPALLVIAFCCTILAGCGSTEPSRFYLLDAVSGPGDAAAGTAADLSVGIGPVALPGYLSRPQIVTRSASPEISVAEFDRWAEPLDENVVRVLADNLSALLGTDRIAVFPWNGAQPLQYRVTVDVTRFDGELGGSAVLSARWALSGEAGAKLLTVRKTTLTEPVEAGGGYEALVGAQSKLLGELSKEIATAITTTATAP